MRSANVNADRTALARIRDAAIDEWGRNGFTVGLRRIAEVAGGVSAALVIHHFGSKDGLRKVCDDHIAETVLASKTESIKTTDPATWFAQMAEIEDYAPMMAYLMRSLQEGRELAKKTLWRTMIHNTELYIEEGVRAGTVKPSQDPRARARFLAMAGGGGFLLYVQMHDNPHRPALGTAGLQRGDGAARPRAVHPWPDGRFDDVRRVRRAARQGHPVDIRARRSR